VGAKSVGQVLAASRALIGVLAEQARGNLVMAEAPGALHARRYEMTPAVSVEKRLLFAGQPAGPLAVKVHYAITVAFDGVRRRDRLGASVAGRLGGHLNLRDWSQQKVARAA